MDPQAPPGRRVRVMATARGDGRVLWDTGIPKGIRTFFMDTVHGDLANDERHFAAIGDLLATGTTSKLPTSPPQRRRRRGAVRDARSGSRRCCPTKRSSSPTALGGRRQKADGIQPQTRGLRVRMVHDNLTNARSPVLVSHYKDDVIVAAEEYLDRRLGGRLSELLRMELYPGPLNTGVVVLNEAASGDRAVPPRRDCRRTGRWSASSRPGR